MKQEWKPYPKDRKIKHCEGYVVIVPSNHNESTTRNTMPLFCNVCGIRFGHKDDENSYKKFGCCSPCADMWAYSNKEKWENGWRPDPDAIQNFVSKRSIVDINIVFE